MQVNPGHKRLDGVKIALVDDDESVRKALERLLKTSGYNVAAFSSAAAFIESHAIHETKCLILDMRMDGMSGADLQTYLAYQGAQIPIIFITGYADEAAQRLVTRLGACAFLHKPMDDTLLLDTLKEAVAAYDQNGMEE